MFLNKRHAVVLGVLFMIALFGLEARAAVFLSVNPIDGGSGIRFERVLEGLKNTKQVQVRINSTNGQQYQVFQRVFEPITNEQGQALNISALETATMVNSNTSGSLYMQNGDHLSYSEQLIYTSSPTGAGDSFLIAYNALPEKINAGGHFTGKVVFTVRVLGQGNQEEAVVDFALAGVLLRQCTVQGGHDVARIRIKDNDINEEQADFIKIAFAQNGKERLSVYQELLQPLINQEGVELPLNVLKGQVALKHARGLVYTSNMDQDEARIYYTVDAAKILEADAGLYSGRVKYTVEAGEYHQEFDLDIELDVRAVFSMDIALPPEGVSFGHVLANAPAQEKQVAVTIKTNLHKPYQVIQSMSSPMINDKGKEFDKHGFTFKVNIAPDQKGRTKFTEESVVETGEYPIYYSDAKGSPATFLVSYQLKGYLDMSPGNFVAPLKFSLNQD